MCLCVSEIYVESFLSFGWIMVVCGSKLKFIPCMHGGEMASGDVCELTCSAQSSLRDGDYYNIVLWSGARENF